MSSDRKRPTAAFWLTVALVAVLVGMVAYPLSFGPAVWLCVRLDAPDWLGATVDAVYVPLTWALQYTPDWMAKLFMGYVDWWTGPVFSSIEMRA